MFPHKNLVGISRLPSYGLRALPLSIATSTGCGGPAYQLRRGEASDRYVILVLIAVLLLVTSQEGCFWRNDHLTAVLVS